MLQNKFEMPLDLEVKSSKFFRLYLLSIFLLSIVSIFISSISLSVKLLLVVLLSLLIIFTVKQLKINKVTNIHLSGVDDWDIEINNNQRFGVVLQGECIVTYFLVWLNFSTCDIDKKKKVFHVLLLPDSSDKDLMRRLRVRLRFLKDITAEGTDVHKENTN